MQGLDKDWLTSLEDVHMTKLLKFLCVKNSKYGLMCMGGMWQQELDGGQEVRRLIDLDDWTQLSPQCRFLSVSLSDARCTCDARQLVETRTPIQLTTDAPQRWSGCLGFRCSLLHVGVHCVGRSWRGSTTDWRGVRSRTRQTRRRSSRRPSGASRTPSTWICRR